MFSIVYTFDSGDLLQSDMNVKCVLVDTEKSLSQLATHSFLLLPLPFHQKYQEHSVLGRFLLRGFTGDYKMPDTDSSNTGPLCN